MSGKRHAMPADQHRPRQNAADSRQRANFNIGGSVNTDLDASLPAAYGRA